MSLNEIEQIELTIVEARKMAKRGEQAKRLASTKDFKDLIMDGYFVDEAARLVHMSSEPTISEDIRNTIVRDMAGPGALKRYFSTIVRMGDMAAQEIEESQETLEELRIEDAQDGEE